MEEKILKVDLACGDNKKKGFIGIDVAKTDSVDIVCDLNTYPWPFEDNSVDELHCSHYIEHIPHNVHNNDKRDGMIQFMDECYRILKPGGILTLVAPYGKSGRALGDPTHTRSIVEESFYYYNKEWRDVNKLSHYGIVCDFDARMSYYIENELTLKSEEVRKKAFKRDWDSILDIYIELTKR